ncbi:hypothetical protein OPV22_002654 [Ensete ventricosum]|uniref:Uncharacterized protein n=1 Tax=Ensete ventricosum TaxID=4639 RepID=A0AAV8RYF1_ENSVE|nr:hypothetical protein OPV22_002654 [Ensete ventricosum]
MKTKIYHLLGYEAWLISLRDGELNFFGPLMWRFHRSVAYQKVKTIIYLLIDPMETGKENIIYWIERTSLKIFSIGPCRICRKLVQILPVSHTLFFQIWTVVKPTSAA